MFLTAPVRLTQSGGWLWSVLGIRHSLPDPRLSLGEKMLKAPWKIPGITRSLIFFVIRGQRSTGSEELEDGGTSVHVRQSKTITDPLLCC